MIERLSRRGRVFGFLGIVALAASAVVGARSMPSHAASAYPSVTDERLTAASTDDGWLMYRRTWDSQGFSPMDQITASNVAGLKPVFTYDTGLKQGHEAPPIVNGRFMYVTTPLDHLIAMDAVTGKVLWKYVHTLPSAALKTVCCDVVNRGVALYGDNVYMETLDNRVIAFDGTSGKIVWNKQLRPPGVGYAMTAAPLAIEGGKIITGIAGGEYGGRGFIVALDAKTGDQLWKFQTVPSPSEPGGSTWKPGMYKTGGGSTWLTGSYDPETKTIFWGVGNPGPWLADLRPGTNLYTDSVVALDPNTGKLKWYYQYTPHDTWDYDATSPQILADLPFNGATVKALIHADRNGYVYALDRSNGKFLWAKPFVKATSVVGFKNGQPVTDPKSRPHLGTSIFTCPSFLGGTNWYPPSYDQTNHMLYLPSNQWCMTMKGVGTDYKAGLPYLGESFKVVAQPSSDGFGVFQAIDMSDGKRAWSYDTKLPCNGPALSTAGGVVFTGTLDQKFLAFDSKSGKILWSFKTNSGIVGVPTTYKVDGKQYVAVFAGYGGATPIWAPATKTDGIPTGGRLYVFALPGSK
jgi:alcohol dehydrogenase (cytochrome c)